MKLTFFNAVVLSIGLIEAYAQQPGEPRKLPPGPMIDGGSVSLETPALRVELLKYSGTAAGLTPTADATLDYTPGDRLKERSADTYYHLGDLDLRFRTAGTRDWKDVSTAFHRQSVVITKQDTAHFVTDLTPTLPSDTPVKLVRTWMIEDDDLLLRFVVSNTSGKTVELGGVGIPMVFNNILSGRKLDDAYKTCSFYDPYIGEDAGYVQVSRLNGHGPVLLVVPEGHTRLEAWKPILDRRSHETGLGLLGSDPTPRGITFEGSFDWMVYSGGFAETEWKSVSQWNPPTTATLRPGESVTFGVRFLVAPELRRIEATLADHKRPLAIGIPGYILPEDIDARLFVRYVSPVRTIVIEPANAIAIHDDGEGKNGLHAYTLRGKMWGRARLVITYTDDTVQSIGYRTIKSEMEAVTDMGRFLFREQWFDDSNDPFHRSPSIISYDRQAGSQVLQEPRVWIAGLSDEAGASSWLTAAMKEQIAPDPEEVAKLESFVDGTLWGHLQESAGEHMYGVRKSLFFYQPDAVPDFAYNPDFNWKSWTSWNQKGASDLGRSYNYPHVVAAYWSLYRIARNTKGLGTRHPWQWYLDQAYETSLAMPALAPYYARFGLMEGTVFIRVLDDMKAEGWDEKAAKLESVMRKRADLWKTEAYPFGSEMPWDSTGQEEVYGWSRYFGYDEKADVTLNAILAYTPVVPSWGYNGSARRYWDFLFAGKVQRIERQLHHYGSGLNAIPLLDEYRAHPEDLYLLRAGYGGVMGPLANIDEKGFASAAFHSFPDFMDFDPYSGDYGPNFFGHVINTGAYLVHDPEMGWLGFGGNITEQRDVVHFEILDSARSRLFVAPLGLWVTLDAGRLTSAEYDTRTRQVRLHLAARTPYVDHARLRLKQTSPVAGHAMIISGSPAMDAGAYVVPLRNGETIVVVR